MEGSSFVDYVKLFCRSGNGGAGIVHFRHDKLTSKGGPDGGDGGRGGHIILRGNKQLWTLLHLKYRKHIHGKNGKSGGDANRTGASGSDIILEVPLGTIAKDAETGETLFEITEHDQQQVLIKGGRGGLGNWHFRSPTNQVPMHAQDGEHGSEGWKILELKLLADVGLVGFPNAGKSTLLNALVNEERAIVSNIAGTTRDTIEVPINISGTTFRLIDTAGIRDASDTIEAIGVKKTYEQIKNAAILLYIFDANDLSELQVLEDIHKLNNNNLNIILVANKCDLCHEHALGMLASSINELTKSSYPIFEISAEKKQNIPALKEYLVDAIGINPYLKDDTLVTNIRHFEALTNCYQSLDKVSAALQNRVTGDFLAQDIRYALHALSEITGDITTEDLLDNIFSKFCIGK